MDACVLGVMDVCVTGVMGGVGEALVGGAVVVGVVVVVEVSGTFLCECVRRSSDDCVAVSKKNNILWKSDNIIDDVCVDGVNGEMKGMCVRIMCVYVDRECISGV